MFKSSNISLGMEIDYEDDDDDDNIEGEGHSKKYPGISRTGIGFLVLLLYKNS